MSENDIETVENQNIENTDDSIPCDVAVDDVAEKVSSTEYEKLYKKELLREILLACLGVVLGTAVMFVIMGLCMSFSMPLIWGSLLGMTTAVLYWLLLYVSKTTVIKIPYIGRMVILIILVIVGLKFDCFYNWAVLIPLAFTKPLAYIFLFIESRKN
ncbi:MAG: hypothetical protein E7384_00670 [Ruminococcaceae bacterium]|nr:hypothetical protein [Oscillospiraceae bacterium]